MRRRWSILLAVSLGVALLALVISLRAQRAPRYQGRPVHTWFEEMLRADIRATLARMGQVGPEAVPFLLNEVRHRNAPL